MKAEKDDIPEYLRHRRSTGPWRFIAILGIGSAVTWTLIALFAKPIVIDVAQLKKAVKFNSRAVFNAETRVPKQQQVARAPVTQVVATPANYTYPNAPTESPISWSQQTKTLNVEKSKKQTVYNDSNYIRSKPINIIQSMPKEKLTTRVMTRNGSSGVAIGIEEKSNIYCESLKAGSIERRECRQQTNLRAR